MPAPAKLYQKGLIFLGLSWVSVHICDIHGRAKTMSTVEERQLKAQCIAEGIMTPSECGRALRFTLTEAYGLAVKGADIVTTIDPVEFATMTATERRFHRREIKRIAEGRRKNIAPPISSSLADRRP
jgi:hypothetical protein